MSKTPRFEKKIHLERIDEIPLLPVITKLIHSFDSNQPIINKNAFLNLPSIVYFNNKSYRRYTIKEGTTFNYSACIKQINKFIKQSPTSEFLVMPFSIIRNSIIYPVDPTLSDKVLFIVYYAYERQQ